MKKLFLFLTLVVLVVPIKVKCQSTLLTGIEEYYKFDETSGQAIDAVGTINSSSVSATRGATGKINTAYSFNGTSDKVTFADHANWTINTTDNLSVSMWIYFTGDMPGTYTTLWGNENGPQIDFSKVSSGNYKIGWWSGGTAEALSSTMSYSVNTWYHLVLVKSGSAVTFYRNGSSIGTPTASDINVNPTAVYIGGDAYTTPQLFVGRIDELGIWGKALTSTEVSQLYNSGTGLSYPFGQTYTLTTSVSPSGSGTLSPANGTYSSGQVVSVTATPASGYAFSSWSGAATGSANPVSITMNANKSLTATFVAGSTLLTGIEEYYRFDETSGQAIDAVGTINSSSVSATQNVEGKINKAYSFDGTSNKVTFPDHANWTINATDNLSISMWIYTTGPIPNNYATLWGNEYGPKFYLHKISAGSYEICWWTDTGVAKTSALTFTLNTWYHIVFVKSGSSVIFYRDGSVAGTATASDVDVNPTAVYIGGDMNSTPQLFMGRIDEVGIWGKALTSTEVTYLYNSGSGLSYSFGTTISVTGVSVIPTTASIVVGGTQQLTATVAPANATNKGITWSSNYPSIASVTSSGLITGFTAGTAIITVTTVDQLKTATCVVTVSPANVPVTGVTLNTTEASIPIGNTQQLTATVDPSNATNKNVTWISSNESKATVSSSGLVTGVAEAFGGAAPIITVTTQDGSKTATCRVVVTTGNVAATGVTVSPTMLLLGIGKNSTLTAQVWPLPATNKTVNWSSSDNSIATVNSSGVVTAVAVGSVNITATTVDGGFTNSCAVTVSYCYWTPGTTGGIYYNSGNVGIGTDAPGAKLDISSGAYNTRLNGNGIMFSRGDGASFISSENTGGYLTFTTNGRGSTNANGNLVLKPDQNSYFNGKVGIGTTNPDATLTVNGNIKAERIDVITDVPASDYVFNTGYKLMTLGELDAFIKANKHLPEVPSADEFKANGYSVGDMDGLLLKKVEELTLYILEQQKTIQTQSKQLIMQSDELKELKQKIEKLKK